MKKRRNQESRIRASEDPLSASELSDFQEEFTLYGLHTAREFFICLTLVWHESRTINDRINELFSSVEFRAPMAAREFLEAYINFYQAVLGLVRCCSQRESHEEIWDLLLELASVLLTGGRSDFLAGAQTFELEIKDVAARADGEDFADMVDFCLEPLGNLRASDRPPATTEIGEVLLRSVLLSARFCKQRKARNTITPLFQRGAITG